jgi:subtilisin family serine protease
MLSGKTGKVFALVLALGLLWAPLSYADVQIPAVTDGPQDTQLELPSASHRLIVELESAPLAVWYRTEPRATGTGGRLDVRSSAAQAYMAQLQAEQAAFVTRMRAALPTGRTAGYINELGARTALDYQITFNGLAIDPGDVDRETARRALLALPEVKNVYLDLAQHTDLYTSTALINAPVLWNQVGGAANGGAGVKVASMDGGIHHDAPMFSGVGWSYPPGYPDGGLGLTSNNNGKIIASRVYFREWDPPAPGDENPWPGVNGTSHGVHTSSTAAGNVATATYANLTFPDMGGVAPGAWVMSYRVFYASVRGDGSFYNAEGIAALEDIVADGADVLNCSWGGGPTSVGGEFDALDTALINATQAGIFVSMSAGNAGPGEGTTDHPSPDYISVAATTTSGTLVAGSVSVSAPEPLDPDLQDMAYTNGLFGPVPATGSVYTYPFVTGESVDETNIEGCNPWPAGSFTGKAAVILRGTCDFSQKVYYAQEGGADFVVIRNHATGGDTLINMAAGAFSDQVTISSIFIGYTNGEAVADWYETYGAASELTYDARAYQAGMTPDLIIDFSSRGPGVGNVLKPDIAAPGVNILAQGYTLGATGEDRHLGWGQVSGTSMAAPHVAGAAALLRQAHPDWSNATIKSALMSTAKYLEVYDYYDGLPGQPLEMGAGRLDLAHAADPGVILDPPSLSYGLVPTDTEKTITFQVTSVAPVAQTYNLSTLYTGAGFAAEDLTELPGFTVNPAILELAPGASAEVQVTFSPTTSAGIGDNQGYIILDGEDYDAHLPAWARVVPAAAPADVLIIQNDFSALEDLPDYLSYYAGTLDALGVSYVVWNADEHAGNPTTLPDPAELSVFKAIVYFTGDNYSPDGTLTVATPLTAMDMDILTQYANGGGTLIAMGQDMASVLGAAAYAAPNWGYDIFLYGWLFGANWLQDSLTNGEQPAEPIIPYAGAPAAFEDVFLSLVRDPIGDGADNQLFIDEISSLPPGEPVPPLTREYQPLLRYPSPLAIEDGGVAMAHRDQPSLERPGISYLGRSIYTSFGLEGVNNGLEGRTSREELLGRFLEWGWDEPTASIAHTGSVDTSKLTYFEASLASNIPGVEAVSYRWDFGDGSAFVGPFANNIVAHTYEDCGIYTVRVEAVDTYGNVAIGSLDADVCAPVVPSYTIYLPLVISSP